MDPNTAQIQFALGFDVSKATITFFDTRTGKIGTVENSKVALRAALKPYAGRGDMLAICEATGGYEDDLLDVLEDLAIPAHRRRRGQGQSLHPRLRRKCQDRPHRCTPYRTIWSVTGAIPPTLAAKPST